ncbi:hypothetical protein NKH18_40950 [Streptomyces sp. M10(2022)]
MTRTAQEHDLSWLNRRPADSQEPGVTAQLLDGLPERTLFVSRPADDGRCVSPCTTARRRAGIWRPAITNRSGTRATS